MVNLDNLDGRVTGLVIAWTLFRFRLLEIVPIARDRVVEEISDAVLVLDRQNRIVDLNPAACQLIGQTARETIPCGRVGERS